jgi:hypothetical protein
MSRPLALFFHALSRPGILNILNARRDRIGESSRRKRIEIHPKRRDSVLSVESESAQ